MLENLEKERLIEKIFIAALKELFSQFYRKYDQESVFAVWAEIMTSRGFNDYLNKWRWEPRITIAEALDSLEGYCHSIEGMIRQHQEERQKGN